MRVQENDGQEITFQDLNRIMQLSERNNHERLLYHFVDKQAQGFFQDSMFVDFIDATHVSVRAGLGIQEDLSQVSPETTKRLLYRPSASTLLLSAADPTDPRKDIVVIRQNRATVLSESRQVKDFITSIVAPQTVVTETDWLSDLLVVEGTPDPAPVEPSVPSGYIKIAVIDVPATTGPTSQSNITDSRTLMPILERTKIDTSLFVAVATKAVGTPLKTVLNELDTLGVAASQALLMYNAIVGSAVGCTHSTIASALTAASAGWRILVTESAAINTSLSVAVANIEMHLKPGVVLSKGTATTGISVGAAASGFEIHGGKISGFNGGGDKAIDFNAAATFCKVWGMRFANNSTNVDDSLVDVQQFGNIEE